MTDPIKVEIVGARYRLIAEIASHGTKADFTIHAIHKDTGRTSVVNQVNAILAVFFPGNFPEDWPWTASWDRAMRWMKTFAEIAQTSQESSWNQLAYLESQLDADRADGAWANYASIPGVDESLDFLVQAFLCDTDNGDGTPANAERRAVYADSARRAGFVAWLGEGVYKWLGTEWTDWQQPSFQGADDVS